MSNNDAEEDNKYVKRICCVCETRLPASRYKCKEYEKL